MTLIPVRPPGKGVRTGFKKSVDFMNTFRVLGILIRDHFRHRRLRTLLTVVGVGIGVAAWLAIRVVNAEVFQSFEQAVESVVGEASVTVSGGPQGVNEQILKSIQGHPGVRKASPVVKVEAEIQASEMSGRSLLIWGLDLLEHKTAWEGLESPSQLGEEDWEQLFSPKTVYLEEALAKRLGLQKGETLSVRGPDEKIHELVVGRILKSSGLRGGSSQQAVMDIAAAQWTFGRIGRLHHVAIIPESDVSPGKIIQELQQVLPEHVQVSPATRRNRQVESMLGAFQLNLTMLSGISLLVGIFLIYNTTAFSVVHHRREIGILRSLGMERASITGLFLMEAVMVGSAGGILGCWLGILFARWLTVMIGQNVGELYGLTSIMAMPIPVHLYIEGLVLGLGVSLIGALVPAWEASALAPVRALAPSQSLMEESHSVRGAIGVVLATMVAAIGLSQLSAVNGIPVGGYMAAFCLLMGGAAAGPVLSHWFSRGSQGMLGDGFGTLPSLAAEQMSRNPRRTSVTMAAIVVGLAILVGVGIMIQSFRQTVNLWIEQTLMADIIIAPTAWLGEQTVGENEQDLPRSLIPLLEEIPGIEAIDPYMETSGEVFDKAVSLVSRDMRLHAERSQYLFLQGDSSEVLARALNEKGVVISEILAARFGLGTGDQLPLETPRGPKPFPIKGVFYDYATDGGKVVMDHTLYAEQWGEQDATVLAVYVKPGSSLLDIRRQIEQTLGNERSIVTISNGELKKEILEIFDRTFHVTYILEVIALSVAVLGIMNTLLTAIMERRRELATLRALGASRGQVQGLIVWESCYLAGMGATVGIAVGMALSVVLIKVINKQSFGWTIQYSLAWESVGMALVVAFAAALLGALAPARWANRQAIAADLRYE